MYDFARETDRSDTWQGRGKAASSNLTPQPCYALNFLAVFTETDAIQTVQKAPATLLKTELYKVKRGFLNLPAISSRSKPRIIQTQICFFNKLVSG